MSKSQTPVTDAVRGTKPSDPPYIPDPVSACSEAAMRLNVVITLLNEHDCDAQPVEDDPNDDGGYTISITRNIVRDIRDLLRASVREAEQARTTGGAR